MIAIEIILLILYCFTFMKTLDKAGNTALYWAAHGGHISCMVLLIQSPLIELNVQVNN